jgi:hypothetical protein
MGDMSEAEARYITVRTALNLAAETISRQHGISVMDATFAMTMVALDQLNDIAPGAMRQVCQTNADVRQAVALGNQRALQKAVKAHSKAVDRFYDQAMARYARATGGLN